MSVSSRTVMVAGVPVELYPAPGPGRQFPWVDFTGLLHAADFLPESVPAWAHLWQANHPDRSYALPDGRLLVPNESALGLFDAARQAGWDRAEQSMQDYTNGSGRYFIELHSDCEGEAFRHALNEAVLRSTVYEVAH